MLLRNKKRQIIDTWNNIDESQTGCWKKPDKKESSVWFHLYKVPQKTSLTYNNRKQMSGCLGMGWRGLSEMGRRGDGKLYFLIMVEVKWVHAFVKTHQNT